MTPGRRARYIAYAIGVTVAVLLVLEALIGREDGAKSQRSDDVHTLRVDPWIVEDRELVPNPRLPSGMAPHRLRHPKGDAWRLLMAGGSFFKGVPFEGEGTIHYSLEQKLNRIVINKPVEVGNGSMSAMASGVVAQVASRATQHEPDALVVATCNNEGTLPPSKVTERLHELGTVQALRGLLRGERAAGDRPVHTPQDPDVDAVRAHFRANLEAIAAATREANVPLLLCTLPVNLLYRGEEAGLPIAGHAWEEQGTIDYGACVRTGMEYYKSRRYERAVKHLQTCDEVEALRWIGLSYYDRGKHERATEALEAYAELMPRNRCRPSFNAVIREVAAAHAHVRLVDLDAKTRAMSAGGLPGPELFVDYCHLRKEAQALVADWIVGELGAAGLVPAPAAP